MKIVALMGSPRRMNTYRMVMAFKEGAENAGHEVTAYNVGKMNAAGCMSCEYCHKDGHNRCIQQDQMEAVYKKLNDCDALVLASPIFYFGITSHLQAAIERMYALDRLPKATKAALILSSSAPDVYDAAIAQYKGIINYMDLEDRGILTVHDPDNGTEETLEKCRELGAAM